MTELDSILKSDDIKRLVALTYEYEGLRWEVLARVDEASSPYGQPGETLEKWAARLDELEAFIDSPELKAEWNDGNVMTVSNPLEFLRLEIRRCRRSMMKYACQTGTVRVTEKEDKPC